MLRTDSVHELAAELCGSGEYHGHLFDSCREFSSIVVRLNQIREQGGLQPSAANNEPLWEQRSQLVRQIIQTPAPMIDDAVVKVTILSSLVCAGEIQFGLTPQCLDDCDRALAPQGKQEQCLEALEPELWNACLRVRKAMNEGTGDSEALCERWWRDFGKAVRQIARWEAKTSIGLKAKGEIFQEVLRFASATEGLGALQMSYMRDFRSLAYCRMNRRPSPAPRPSDI